jgi:hypothetical protein
MMARIGVMKALNRHSSGCSIPSAKIHIGGNESSSEISETVFKWSFVCGSRINPQRRHSA